MSEAILFQGLTQDITAQQAHTLYSGDWSVATYQDGAELPICVRKSLLEKLFPLLPVSPFLNFDSSSVLPQFQAKIETAVAESKVLHRIKLFDTLQNEVIFRMPPVSKVAIVVRIRKIEKAEPHILKPEEV